MSKIRFYRHGADGTSLFSQKRDGTIKWENTYYHKLSDSTLQERWPGIKNLVITSETDMEDERDDEED